MNKLKSIYRRLLPESIRYKILQWRKAYKLHALKKAILDFYRRHPSDEAEINEALTFLKNNPLTVFPYPFSEKYKPQHIHVHTDIATGLRYVMYHQHKLFFKRSLTVEEIQHSYSFLLCEQDSESPHCYLHDGFLLNKDAVLADIGCAEGIFSLMNIDTVKHVYLFEANKEWIEALEQTFTPWQEKVTIVNKFVSDKTAGDFICLDDYFDTVKPDFLKIDVDGAEADLLKGSETLITSAKLQIALCTYHKQNDATEFETYLQHRNYNTAFSKNVMLFYFDEAFNPPYFRKALLRAYNSW